MRRFLLLAIFALAPATGADPLLPVRAVVTAVTSESITAKEDSTKYRFPLSLLGVDASPGDSLLLEVAADPPNNSRVHEAWKMTREQPMEHEFIGIIYSEHAADTAAKITFVVDALETERAYKVQATRSQLDVYAPGDTARVLVKYHALVRKTKEGTETMPDYERYDARLVRINKRQ